MQLLNYKMFRDNSEDEKSDIFMYYSGQEQCIPSHFWYGIRDHYLIHYVLSGKGKFEVMNKTYSLSKGNGFLVTPGTISYYQADASDPWKYCWFSFNGKSSANCLNKIGLTIDNPIFYYDSDDALEACILEMQSSYQVNFGRSFLQTSLIYKFFSKLSKISDSLKQNNKSPNLKELYLKKAISFIERNYSRQISVTDISKYIGIDSKYLSSIFHELIQVAPKQFLILYRINKACELMSKNGLNIKTAALSVGYEDPLLFSKIFKKVKGFPPKEFIKSRKDLKD